MWALLIDVTTLLPDTSFGERAAEKDWRRPPIDLPIVIAVKRAAAGISSGHRCAAIDNEPDAARRPLIIGDPSIWRGLQGHRVSEPGRLRSRSPYFFRLALCHDPSARDGLPEPTV